LAAWAPYAGTDAVALTVVLLIVGLFFAFLGTRLKNPRGTQRPSRTTIVLVILIWVLAILAFLVDSSAYIRYVLLLLKYNLLTIPKSTAAPNPVSSVTELSAVVSFVLIAYLTRKHGIKVALLSAFVGAAVGPMIFELPFDMIVFNMTLGLPTSPTLLSSLDFRALYFLPLFLIELSTMLLVTFSPLAKISKYTMFSLAGMFLVFAAWASIGFPYPSDALPTLLNDVGKVLSFVVAITLFLGDREGKNTGSPQPSPPRPTLRQP
jgi:hypothetical protein